MTASKEPYGKKFADFIRMCGEAKSSGVDVVVISHPHVIGDDYEEIIQSLNTLARADLKLAIAEPEPRSGPLFDPQNN
ncbi:MAG: hypothetical protein ACYS9X_07560 [Planctomycetota bacterium]|jgi:dihydrodipicolinate synthase/N-acetylneuraminate lyase